MMTLVVVRIVAIYLWHPAWIRLSIVITNLLYFLLFAETKCNGMSKRIVLEECKKIVGGSSMHSYIFLFERFEYSVG